MRGHGHLLQGFATRHRLKVDAISKPLAASPSPLRERVVRAARRVRGTRQSLSVAVCSLGKENRPRVRKMRRAATYVFGGTSGFVK